MNSPKAPPAVAWAILAFAGWQASDLLAAWRHSPLDRLGGVAFLVWALPVPLALATGRRPFEPRVGPWLLGASVPLALLSAVLSLNLAAHVALALAIAAFAGWTPRHVLWLAAAICWMPVFTWLGKQWPPSALAASRVAVALLAALAAAWTTRTPAGNSAS